MDEITHSIKLISLISYNALIWSVQRKNKVILDHPVPYLPTCLSVTSPSIEARRVWTEASPSQYDLNLPIQRLNVVRRESQVFKAPNQCFNSCVVGTPQQNVSVCLSVCHKPTLRLF